MSKKKGILIIIVLGAILSIILLSINKPKHMYAHISIGCSVVYYTQQQNIGYITMEIEYMNNATEILKVEDAGLQKRLMNTNLPDIIGVNIFMRIPIYELEKNGINIDNFDALGLLIGTNQYDDYFYVRDVYLSTVEPR